MRPSPALRSALGGALAALVLAAPAQATITPTRDASAVAEAITEQLPLDAFTGRAVFTTIPASQYTNPVAIGDDAGPLAGFPTSAPRYAILTTGNATSADDPNDDLEGGKVLASNNNGGGPGNPSHGDGVVFDLVTLRVDLDVPPGSSCLRLDVRFLSEEIDQADKFNDAFIAELDESTFSGAATGQVVAPDNFASDADGNLISAKTTAFSPAEAAGTIYDGATPPLRASTPITPGSHSLYLSVFDHGDPAFDSAAFIDAIRLNDASGDACRTGAAAVDDTAPAVTVTSPAPGSTVGGSPVFSGAAGDAMDDSGTVTVRVFGGPTATGQAVQQLTATRSGASWSVQGGPLTPGTYTVQAQQGDASGNVGSAASTFAVAPPVIVAPRVLAPPVTAKTVNVEPVRGTVTVRVPGGKTVRLEDAEQIPTGSVIDTRKGAVRLFSTGAGGKVQNALFFDGLFRVTQTKGSRPLTILTLTEKLARCRSGKSGKAKTSAKRRKRRLWGDGSGAFRTSGRRSAATVSGTKWLVEDSCAGTLTRVARGKVKVRDFKRKKTVTVRAGHSYRAR